MARIDFPNPLVSLVPSLKWLRLSQGGWAGLRQVPRRTTVCAPLRCQQGMKLASGKQVDLLIGAMSLGKSCEKQCLCHLSVVVAQLVVLVLKWKTHPLQKHQGEAAFVLCQHHLSFFRLLKKSVGTDGNAEKDDKTNTLNVTNKKRLLPCTVSAPEAKRDREHLRSILRAKGWQ